MFLYNNVHSSIVHNSQKVKWNSFSCVQFFEAPWTVACQALLSMEFSRQEGMQTGTAAMENSS